MSEKLFIGNLSFDTTAEEIRTLLTEVGVIESCEVMTDRETGRSRGYAFVQMPSKEAALSVKEKFNGHELKGRSLRVKYNQSR
jgi:RNA recognition motif-containing protein